MMIPHEYIIDMKELLELPEIRDDLKRHPKFKGMVPDGQIGIVRDPKIIDQMNFSASASNKSVRAPKITNTTNQRLSSLSPRKVMLDNIEIH